jgi:DNA-binding transcriptional MerR regulator
MSTEMYSPKKFGTMIGRSTNTLQRWDREGILPAKRTPTDRRYYTHDDYLKVIGQKTQARVNVSYVRVSSSSQKNDLQSQKKALEIFCTASGPHFTNLFSAPYAENSPWSILGFAVDCSTNPTTCKIGNLLI